MKDRFDPSREVPPEHVQRVGQQMRDETELDNLKADIRTSRDGKPVVMPWRTGRPLRSTGHTDPETGLPVTPLTELDLKAVVTPEEVARLGREFERVKLQDAVSEGCLDNAEAEGTPLVSEEQWWEANPDPELAEGEGEEGK
jgi:hypothetical protein